MYIESALRGIKFRGEAQWGGSGIGRLARQWEAGWWIREEDFFYFTNHWPQSWMAAVFGEHEHIEMYRLTDVLSSWSVWSQRFADLVVIGVYTYMSPASELTKKEIEDILIGNEMVIFFKTPGPLAHTRRFK